MKNKLFVFIATLLLVSCWNTKNTKQNEDSEDSTKCSEALQFTTCNYIKKKKLSNGEYPKYDISIKVQYVEGESEVAQTINKQLATFLYGDTSMSIEKANTCFGDSVAQNFEKELTEFYEPDNEYQETFAYEYTQKDTVSPASLDGYICYVNRIESYTGGAHGGAYESYINLCKETGQMITAKELFGEHQDDVLKLIKDQIVKDNDCKTAAELEEKRSIFALGDVYITDNNFQLQKDGILFCYNPYEIAPWSEGFIFAKLTYKQLEGLMVKNIVK